MLLLHCRITPAGAGKTLKYILLCPKWWDHPRRCGENKDPELLLMYILGSPPQVRGKPFGFHPQKSQRRITPAGAGKTRLGCWAYQWATDHPRRCGENYFVKPAALRAIGSPPQVRGKLSYSRYVEQLVRITPAGAGKTDRSNINLTDTEDHPPQVRGKRNASYHSARFGRITPAGAGKTLLFANFRAFQWDHPRRCGENVHISADFFAHIGSPPQVRGKPAATRNIDR